MWFSISFFKDWALWTLSLASGGPTVAIALYFFLQGKEPPKSGLLTVLGGCSLFAAWGAGLREGRLRVQVEMDLAKERDNLTGCPHIILQHEGTRGNFYVHNSGTVDGIAITLNPIESPNYVLTSDPLPRLAGGASLTLKLLGQRPGGTLEEGLDAWNSLAMDRWVAVHPREANESQIDKYNRILKELITERLLIAVRVTYRDLAGKYYESPAIVAWDTLSDSIEVRPGVITKKTIS
jgi:hypothetical protein